MRLVLLSALYLVYTSIVVFNTYTLKIISWDSHVFSWADNRRKADENEQSTDGLCHLVDDQQAVYNRGAAGDHRSEDSRGAAGDDQQAVDVRNEECGSRQLEYCIRPSNICDLPDEILHMIFEHVASGGGTNIGLNLDDRYMDRFTEGAMLVE